jgi:hypothetical protein
MMISKFFCFRSPVPVRLLRLALVAAVCAASQLDRALAQSSDPAVRSLIQSLVQKGFLTDEEGTRFQAEMDSQPTNTPAPASESKLNINPGIKNLNLYGDLRTRFEDRSELDPSGDHVELQRFRYAARLGLRGEAFEDFYYGLRVETASNPRSAFVTMGTSASGTPYQGPYGKSTAGISIGQIYIGWHPESWLDLTVGKMPNPLYTTTMLWSRNINPEGLAERLNYTVGEADLFANFGQFLYQDANPVSASPDLGLGPNNDGLGQANHNIFQIAWQGGLNYHLSTNTSFKIAATVYEYYGIRPTTANTGGSPYFGDTYVGEGAYTGLGSLNYPVNGYSGYTTGALPAGVGISSSGFANTLGYPNNQVGINNLLVLEVPFEFNFKINQLDARIFGDAAYNLDGAARARAAQAAYAAYLTSQSAMISSFSPQTRDVKACQIGFALGNKGSLGLGNGAGVARKNAWEARAYWQHVEQYSLDPNLLDLDVFAAAENMQGVYAEAAYGFSQNFIAAFHYGYATRINDQLGTGGTGTDIPQINPITRFELYQLDLTFKF